MTDLLFAYGTLLPGDVRWHFLQPFVVDEGVADRARGTLYDTGCDYPAARFASDTPDGTDTNGTDTNATDTAGTIVGRVFRLVVDRRDEALARLDEVEGAVTGDYRRVLVDTLAGHRAWAYAYGGGLDLAPIADGSWVVHRTRLGRLPLV